MNHDDWHRRASILARDTSLSWREIARRIGKPKSTVADYLRSEMDADPVGAKVLIFDIETAPGVAFIWSRWDKFVSHERIISEPGNVLTWSAKWLGADEVMNDASINYCDDPLDDFGVVDSLRMLLDECDIAVAHNGDRFDIKKLNTRFLYHGMRLPSPYKSVDTYKALKRVAGLDSASLDNAGAYFGLGRKLKHTGFELWRRCIDGDKAAFEEMLKYNDQDVLLLERLYLKLRPADHRHPNLALYSDMSEVTCPRCNSSNVSARKDTYTYTSVAKYQVYECGDCGAYARSRVTALAPGQRQNIIASTK